MANAMGANVDTRLCSDAAIESAVSQLVEVASRSVGVKCSTDVPNSSDDVDPGSGRRERSSNGLVTNVGVDAGELFLAEVRCRRFAG